MTRRVILLYIEEAGVPEAIDHIFDGRLKQYKPTVTVDNSIYGVTIPMMSKDGLVEGTQSASIHPINREGSNPA